MPPEVANHVAALVFSELEDSFSAAIGTSSVAVGQVRAHGIGAFKAFKRALRRPPDCVVVAHEGSRAWRMLERAASDVFYSAAGLSSCVALEER
jgi:hypothetical protein